MFRALFRIILRDTQLRLVVACIKSRREWSLGLDQGDSQMSRKSLGIRKSCSA